ncbi:MAG: KH domain-containing protein [Acidobacteriota bacterium]
MKSPVASQLALVLRLLVDEPGKVEVAEVDGDGEILFEVRVAPDDFGKLIGRRGRTIGALRSLLRARGLQEGKRYGLELLED